MQALEEHWISCPYCGESISVLIDCSIVEQQYIEDCQVCCRPIEFAVYIGGDNEVSINVTTDND